MEVVLKPHEHIDVVFAETDGKIAVHFSAGRVYVMSNLTDTTERDVVVYQALLPVNVG